MIDILRDEVKIVMEEAEITTIFIRNNLKRECIKSVVIFLL